MARIFISYKRVDKEKAFDLKKQIETYTGEKCWIDLDGIESDAQFKNVIINAIKQCEVVLFLYSKVHASIVDFEKDWTVRELNFASAKNKRIVFINLDGTPLTDEFSFDYGLKQQVDGQSPEAISRLISDLKKWLNLTNIVPSDQEILNEKKRKKETINLSISSKGCVVAVSILASVCFFVFPTFWLSKSPRFLFGIEDSPSVELEQKNPNQEPLIGIDLGLPSGTLWANMNVGAKALSDYGNYFAWGESEIKDNYFEYNYVKETKGQTLHRKHDAAYTILGAEWQTPSSNDFQELIDNCRWIWTSLNGHNGYKIMGRNGNAIFLPASGWIHTDSVEYRNEYGYYWTSDGVNDTFAKELLFSKSEKKLGNGYLWYGRCVRPVKQKL